MSIDAISRYASMWRTATLRCARLARTTTWPTCVHEIAFGKRASQTCECSSRHLTAGQCSTLRRAGPAFIVRCLVDCVRSILRWEFPSEGGVD
eukprot:2701833-Pleurochrysis_carterae.AAC.1